LSPRSGMTTTLELPKKPAAGHENTGTATMRATVFHGVGDIRVEEVPRPHAGPGEAVIHVTMTTICGTDLHILRGEFEIWLGNKEHYRLKTGDSLYFESSTPHRWRNPGRAETWLLWVNTPPTF